MELTETVKLLDEKGRQFTLKMSDEEVMKLVSVGLSVVLFNGVMKLRELHNLEGQDPVYIIDNTQGNG